MSYGELIRDAFRTVWRNRYLWFFGFFVAGSGFSFNVPGGPPGGLPDSLRWAGENLALVVAAAALLALVLLLVYLVLGVVSAGGLAWSVAAIERGERPGFSSTFRAGLGSFWGVLGQAILLLLIGIGLALAVFVAVGGPFVLLLALTESVAARVVFGVLLGLLGVVLLVVLYVPYAVVGQFALRELVVGRRGALDAIGGAFGLFRRNAGKSILVWVINLALSIGVGVALAVVFILLGIALFMPAIALGTAGHEAAAVAAGVVAGLVLLPLLLVATGAVGAFFHAYWTLAYLRLSGAAPPY
ncbi:hypothetical protein Rxyl_0038 [Rubrobacter xylanophilus DSM 9941]|uniref:Glycerophosphoryl diester phosphodiesterase membrane domain-containing protein n=1 Tax=Rubrobacter xylanophilus (strain DSM 9941 / JCM 11954 / NBRC 16129 / PRD-1) TaxID=266117 RepID=Q1B009_RUBXD|nr:hypothetical protein [Rubrobacter xylanophilus]ABG03019.1 hypothetical protein Rxyl_0038 [Rubrobacter xylanophilus DSM 9941]